MYSNSAHQATCSDSSPSDRATWLADVEHLRSTPDDMVSLTLVRDGWSGTAIRFTFRNKASVLVDRECLRYWLKRDLPDIQGDPLPALTLKIARSLFRSRGGRKWLGVTFEDWMTCRA